MKEERVGEREAGRQSSRLAESECVSECVYQKYQLLPASLSHPSLSLLLSLPPLIFPGTVQAAQRERAKQRRRKEERKMQTHTSVRARVRTCDARVSERDKGQELGTK